MRRNRRTEGEPMADIDQERTYEVIGMTCHHCELSVQEEVAEIAGVRSAMADHERGRLTVIGESIDDHAVERAVEEAGYRVTP